MISNIPIYRAKKIDSDECVIGWYSSPIIIEGKLYLSITNQDGEHRIDTTTLSIHFPDMIDSQGNKIFASLQEDGRGGDILYYKSKIDLVTKTTLYFENYRLITHSKGENTFRDKESLSKFEIIGIKE